MGLTPQLKPVVPHVETRRRFRIPGAPEPAKQHPTITSGHLLRHVNCDATVYRFPMSFMKAEPHVERYVLGEQFVCVKTHFAKVLTYCFCLSELHELATKAGALKSGINGDVFDEEMIVFSDKLKNGHNPALAFDNPDLMIGKCVAIVCEHWFRLTSRSRYVHPIRL